MAKTGENIYKRKDGRWEGRFISARKPDGKAKYASVYARTYTEVKAKLEERKRTFVKRPVGSCRLTVKELFAWYLAQVDVKPSTRARYSFLIEKHILPFMGMLAVTALTAKCLTDFLNQKQKTGRLSGGSLSAKSVRDIGVLLKGALRFAAREFQFYCDALNVPLPAAKKPRIEPFSAWELAQIGKALLPSANHKNAGILLSANGGLRLGEVCALRVSDIDFQNGTVRIERAAQRIRQNGNTRLIVQTPKSESSVRIVPLPEDMMIFLKKAVSGLPENAYLLTGRSDKPMEPRNYQYYFESVLRRCGLKKRCYHTLRHSYATRCIPGTATPMTTARPTLLRLKWTAVHLQSSPAARTPAGWVQRMIGLSTQASLTSAIKTAAWKMAMRSVSCIPRSSVRTSAAHGAAPIPRCKA